MPESAALLTSDRYRVHRRVEIRDADGNWRDLTDLGGVDWVTRVSWGSSVDEHVDRGEVTVRMDDGAATLSPLVRASPYNRTAADQYDPLLRFGREIRIWSAITAVGAEATVWRLKFHGYLDQPNTGRGGEIVVPFRDLGAALTDVEIADPIRVAFYTPATGPVALEVALQEILDEALGAGAPTLYVPTATGVTTPRFEVPAGQLFDSVRKVAARGKGWDVRYLYDAGTESFRLTLFQPDRSKTVPDLTIGPDIWSAMHEQYEDVDRVRNRVRVGYGDGSFLEGNDAGSQAVYRTRLINLVDETSSILETQADADELVTAVLADLAVPPVVMRVEQLYDPRVKLGDLIRWSADGRRSDEDVDGAVVAFTHVLERDVHRTTIQTRQAPTGSPKLWADMSTLVPRPPARDVWYEDPTRQNLLIVPGNDINTPIVHPSTFWTPLEYIRRVVDTGTGVSGSLIVECSDPSDSFRPAIWFTDDADSIVDRDGFPGSPAQYLGLIRTGPEGLGHPRVNSARIPSAATRMHIGIVPVGTPAGTFTLSRPIIHRGTWGGLFTGSDGQAELDVALKGFRVASEDDDEVTYDWTRGEGVDDVLVWDRTALPWPSISSTPDSTIGFGTDEYTAAKPGSGRRYVQFATETAAGVRNLQRQVVLEADAAALEFTGQIKQSPVSVGGSENYATDLSIDVSGDAAAFPIDAEVRIESKDGTIIASHTFASAGTITKATAAGLGARSASEIGWWLKLTTSDGRVRWVDTVNRLLNLGTDEFSGLIGETKISSGSITTPKLAANSVTATKIAAGAVTASKIDVTTLSAITANLGTVNIGDSGEGTIRLWESGVASGSINAGSSGSIVGMRLSRSASITIGIDVGVPETAIRISAASVYLSGNVYLGTDEIDKGANDSGGAGWRMLRVPNS